MKLNDEAKKYFKREQKREQMRSTPGWEVHWACSRLVSCNSIFIKNSDELLSFLKDPPYIPFKFLLPDSEARIKKIESDQHAIRLIHNYVAAARTLVDHTRRLKRKYLDQANKEEFDRRVQVDFKDHIDAQIVLELRNYILHVSLPSICNRVSTQNGKSRLAFLPKNLLLWDGWKKEVKEHLKALDDTNLMLYELFEDYTSKTTSFNDWFLQTIISCQHDNLETLYTLNDEVLESVRENGLITDPLIVVYFTRLAESARELRRKRGTLLTKLTSVDKKKGVASQLNKSKNV